MKRKLVRPVLILVALLVAALGSVRAQEVTGDWQGTLSAGTLALHLVLPIRTGADGSLQATLDSVDQGANRIPVVSIPGSNHLFQTAKTGASGEYAEIEETISPIALKKIAGRILQR